MSEMDRKLLERYLAGHASAEENARVEAWLAEDPERCSSPRYGMRSRTPS